MDIYRVLYEKGLDLQKASDGRWYFESATDHVAQIPQKVPEQFGVRAIVTRSFARAGFPAGTKIVQFGSQHEPYYEFEALVTSVRRAYDSARYILWKEFHTGKGSTPSSFCDTLKLCKSIPIPLEGAMGNKLVWLRRKSNRLQGLYSALCAYGNPSSCSSYGKTERERLVY